MLAGSSTGAPVAALTGLGYRTTASTDIILTTGGASATGAIYTWVYYTVE
jgi:ribulose kinase